MVIKRHIIGTKEIETIQTREISKVLYVKLENDRSLVELFVAEDDTTPEFQKNFLIIQEKYRILYSYDELEYVGTFSVRNGLFTFYIFEIKSDYIKNINSPIKKIEDVEINIVQPIIKETIKKWKRLPKPDLNKTFTEEELKDMHPERQLKYILNKKYNLKGKVINKLSVENQINYIISIQDGNNCPPEQLLQNQNLNINNVKETNNNRFESIPTPIPTINEIEDSDAIIVETTNNIQVTLFDSIEEDKTEKPIYRKLGNKIEISHQYVLPNRYTEVIKKDIKSNVILVLVSKLDNQII